MLCVYFHKLHKTETVAKTIYPSAFSTMSLLILQQFCILLNFIARLILYQAKKNNCTTPMKVGCLDLVRACLSITHSLDSTSVI